jgi:glycosyltransferase involved in cell wall biosynthesis
MTTLPGVVRHYVHGAYLAASAGLTRHLLREQRGGRDFRRVVIVAPLSRNNGIASGARLQWAALRGLGVEIELVDATPALRNPLLRIPHRPGSAYIFHAGAPQMANLIASVLPHAAQAYRVGYWAWELPDPPRDWAGCDRTVAEIWTPSEFSKESLQRLTDRRIAVVPHHIPVRPARQCRGAGPFTVLAMADSRSSWSRKNPEGALRAFRQAFGGSTRARLLLKLGGRSQELAALETVMRPLLDGGNVEIIRGHLDESALDALFDEADVLLSLHRAEGYGLPLNEAMARGVPVVATGWSGNVDFMSSEDSCLVPYKLVPVRDDSSIYRHSVWAEPDIDAAACALRRLATEPSFYARLAAAAHKRARALQPRFPFSVPAPEAAAYT